MDNTPNRINRELRLRPTAHIRRGDMNTCSFKKLVQLLDKQLDLDEKLEVLAHLESCGICRDAVYQISRDRDESLFVHRPYNVEKNVA
jgi:hypothetical protein